LCAVTKDLAGGLYPARVIEPTNIIVIFGMISASSMIADPHAGQKRR